MEPLPFPEGALSALIVVDMQAFFFREPERRIGLGAVVANINRLSAHFDAAGQPVVHVLSAYRADGNDWDLKMLAAGTPELIAGTEEAAILEGIRVGPGHTLLTKTRYSAFFKTDLAERLHAARVSRAVVVGAYTHHCVNATVWDAYCHNFVPGLITDAVASHRREEAALMVARMARNGYHVMTTAEYLSGAPPRTTNNERQMTVSP